MSRHDFVEDEVVERVHRHVLAGMGLVVLHSAHFSKIFIRLMGTTCSLRWRQGTDREVIWTVAPTHPIAAGVPQPLVLPAQEMYGEHFDVPVPDDLVFVSGFTGGEVFRSGMTYSRGHGRIFYFSPGDQDYPGVPPARHPARPGQRRPLGLSGSSHVLFHASRCTRSTSSARARVGRKP